jgi:isoleucyl-tRNA synthetase
VRRAYEEYEFHIVFHSLNQFCTVDLSSLYLDVLKDRLYCDAERSTERRSAQTVIYRILTALTRLMAPVLSFTAEEIWAHIPGEKAESVHLEALPDPEGDLLDDALASDFERLLRVRGEAAKVIEAARSAKQIGSSTEARLELVLPEAEREIFDRRASTEDLGAFFLVSEIALADSLPQDAFRSEEIEGLWVRVEKAGGTKCARCWLWRQDVGAKYPDACGRCAKVLDASGAQQ